METGQCVKSVQNYNKDTIRMSITLLWCFHYWIWTFKWNQGSTFSQKQTDLQATQRYIQKPVSHLRWRVLRKQAINYFHKTLHLRFDRVLERPLQLLCCLTIFPTLWTDVLDRTSQSNCWKLMFCSKCCKIFKVCLIILRHCEVKG